MLLLVLSDRNDLRAVDQNVGGLKHGVREQPVARAQALGHLVLVRVTPLQQAHGRHAGQDPRQLGNLGNIRLPEENRPCRVQAQRQITQRDLLSQTADLLGVAQTGQGMVICNEIEAFVAFLLKPDVLTHGAEVIAKVQFAGWLDA